MWYLVSLAKGSEEKIKQNSLSDIILLIGSYLDLRWSNYCSFRIPGVTSPLRPCILRSDVSLRPSPQCVMSQRKREHAGCFISIHFFFPWLILEGPVQRSTIHCRIFWRMREHCCFSTLTQSFLILFSPFSLPGMALPSFLCSDYPGLSKPSSIISFPLQSQPQPFLPQAINCTFWDSFKKLVNA